MRSLREVGFLMVLGVVASVDLVFETVGVDYCQGLMLEDLSEEVVKSGDVLWGLRKIKIKES